jgi:chromosomal replication initiator protein
VSLAHVPAQARSVEPPPLGPSIRAIQDAVCEVFGVSWVDLISNRRAGPVVHARHAAMWLARWHTFASYPEIGRAFRRDHTSIIHGVSRVEERMARDDVFAARVRKLAAALDPVIDDAGRAGAGVAG